MWVLTGGILLLASVYSGLVGYSDSGSTDVDVPSCTSAELQDLGGGVNFCDKSVMMDSEMPVPDMLQVIISIEVEAQWDVPDVWIGVVADSEAEKCTESSDGLLLCDTADLVFYAGGPDANGRLNWEIGEGTYRFVAGSSAESSGKTTHIEYSYTVQMTVLLASGIGTLGLLMVGWGIKSD